MDDRPSKCTVATSDDGAVEVIPCWALQEHMDYSGGRGTKAQGLTQPTLVNMKTHKISRRPIVFKGGQHTKGGTQLRFCPWCGGHIATYDDSDQDE